MARSKKKHPKEGIHMRLREALVHTGKLPADVTKAIGASSGTLSYLLSEPEPGQDPKRSKYTPAIARYLGVNAVWLADGRGGMLDTNAPERPGINLDALDWPLVVHCAHRVIDARPDDDETEQGRLVRQLYEIQSVLDAPGTSPALRELLTRD